MMLFDSLRVGADVLKWFQGHRDAFGIGQTPGRVSFEMIKRTARKYAALLVRGRRRHGH